jgi:hypothetical protein
MITPMIISTLLLLMVSLVVFYEYVKGAAQGYEDDYGFHEGTDPQSQCFASEPILATSVKSSVPSKKVSRTRRSKARPATEIIEHGSAAPFSS